MEWQRETIGIERIGGRAKIADYSGLGTGKTDHFVTVMGSKNIGEYLLANISYFAIGQQDDSRYWTQGRDRIYCRPWHARECCFVGITYAFGTLYRPHHFPAAGVQRVP
jgi:hypothetical protein